MPTFAIYAATPTAHRARIIERAAKVATCFHVHDGVQEGRHRGELLAMVHGDRGMVLGVRRGSLVFLRSIVDHAFNVRQFYRA